MDLGSVLQWTTDVDEERRQSNSLAETSQTSDEADDAVSLNLTTSASLRLCLNQLCISTPAPNYLDPLQQGVNEPRFQSG